MSPFILLVCLIVHTIAIDIIGILSLLFLRPWGPRVHRLVNGSTIANWLESLNCLLPSSTLISYGDAIPSEKNSYGSLFSGSSSSSLVSSSSADTSPTPALFSSTDPGIIICNHQVDMDWYYLWGLLIQSKRHGQIRIILKDTLKYIPVLGLAMQFAGFIFVRRDWQKDGKQLRKQMEQIVVHKIPAMLLIFPEGTTINTQAQEKSRKYSIQESRPLFNYLLLPRSTGFSTILSSLSGASPVVYDITMAYDGYTGEIPTYEMGYERNKDHNIPNAGKILRGHHTVVHMDVATFSAKDIGPTVEEWLDYRWLRKECLLSYFAKHQKFPETEEDLVNIDIEDLFPSQELLEEEKNINKDFDLSRIEKMKSLITKKDLIVGKKRIAKSEGNQNSLIFLWMVVLLSVIILPFALMLFIPYSLIITISYSYIKWHEYTRGMLSREEKMIKKETIMFRVFKVAAVIFMIGTLLAWAYSTYSLLSSFFNFA